ncbi:hypothetical protein IKE72_02680 [Candidatus Saccharibacteria bacterium]|nr:hypothetical protein [Candidatus Saccharibacteria bacterium]
MKLKINGSMYLQKYEAVYILRELARVPVPIMEEIFKNSKHGFFFMSDLNDGLRFNCVFHRQENMRWITEQDWIVDYDEYAEMPLYEMERLIQDLKEKNTDDVKDFNESSESHRRKHFREERDRLHKLEHKIASLEYMVSFRKGEVAFDFPEEYDAIEVLGHA